jgi:beta-barrel assembly-enhancing protease
MCVRAVAMVLIAGAWLSAQQSLGPVQDRAHDSLEKEAALGKQLAADFRRRTIPIDSSILQTYLDRLGHKIGAQMPDVSLPFTFSAIAGEPCGIREPAALPGGYIFVPVGLLIAAREEGELAGMLAHAMAHVAQHPLIPRGTLGTPATIPLIFIGGSGGDCPGGPPVPQAFLAMQRSAERQADVLAAQTMARAGFEPKSLVRYIERVQSSNADSSILDRDERIAALLAAIQKLPGVSYAAAPAEEFGTARREALRLTEAPLRSAPPSLMGKKQEPR